MHDTRHAHLRQSFELRYKKNCTIKEGRKRELTARNIGWRMNARIFIRNCLNKKMNKLVSAAKKRLRDFGLMKFVWPSEEHMLMGKNKEH